MDSERYQWRGEDDPSRIDTAYVRFRPAAMRAHGSSVTRQYTLSWTLDVGEGWLTQHLRVRVLGKGWSRSLDLRRDSAGEWRSTVAQTGTVDLPAPGIGPDVDLHDAVDCDLGLCPVTNVMPIRRLDLHRSDHDETRLAMAWVEVPTLRVLRKEQLYSSHYDGVERKVRYRTGDGEFTSDITVDHNGMVIDYPGLAWRVTADA
ncbi:MULTISPECIES: putative glycolipid-binding domain-containing protein [unclassified Microbacterium]|uniref:putative glycolipid-binding domain-containing protein n=1 Tax=unclassified Microbacterium TaxID=2609290 RepID=UPI00214BD283|nr:MULTISPECIES: putative glycolipid-binding domain-containing protein [unclassified Microbacterium]MCR2783922.1 putative glycolipid-binding domain-containing protein [Microbacterium sp. zg.B96]MDL5351286.1 putative glycolipid-binding domain-containing protein [Microbacterium sp. zg-YB36]WIM15233.1 putative glycolipid-binding domain-containing protein [Microbacterium sp. zg-B96]